MPIQLRETATPGTSPLRRIFAGGERFPLWHTLLAVLLLVCLVQQPLRLSRHMRTDGGDLRTLIAGAACLREGCSPYDTDALNRMFVERDATVRTPRDWALQLPIYPPQTMALLMPLTYGTMQTGLFLNWAITWTALLLCIGAVILRSRTLETASPLLRSALVGVVFVTPRMIFALSHGNPVVLATALLLFAVADLPERYGWLRVTALGLACLLKPQLALPFALVLMVRSARERRRLVVAAVAVAAFSAGVWGWCMTHPALRTWLPDLQRELALGSASGNSMNPTNRIGVFDSLLNMDYMLGYFLPRHDIRAAATALIVLLLLLLLLFGAWRIWRAGVGTAPWQTALLTAAVCTWTLLPVYHRFYDCLIVTLAAPWLALAFSQRRTWVPASIALVLSLGVQAEPELIFRNWKRFEGLAVARSVPDFLLRRYGSLCTFLLCCLLVTLLLRVSQKTQVQAS